MARAGSVVSGTVTGEDAKPVAGATVTFNDEAGTEPEATAKTGDDGVYKVDGIEPKAYTLTVDAPDGRHAEARVSVSKRRQVEDITLPTGGPDMHNDPAAPGGGAAPAAPAAPNGNGAAQDAEAFDKLVELIESPDLAPEPPVNIEEATELERLFVISMYLLAGVPEAVTRLFTSRDANYQAGDLTLQKMDQLPPEIQDKLRVVVDRMSEPFDTRDELLAEIRAGFNLGTAAVPAVNAEFGGLYRGVANLASDDRSGVDPDKVLGDDPRLSAEIHNLLRDLKRAILRLTQNMSVYGTKGTSRLTNKWSKIMLEAVAVLNHVATNNVVSSDKDDQAPWSLLAALTDTPRGTVKAYIVNARDGGEMLRLTIGIYDAIQDKSNLDNEDQKFLRDLFFSKGGDVFKDPLKSKPSVKDTEVGVALKSKAAIVRDYVAPLWP